MTIESMTENKAKRAAPRKSTGLSYEELRRAYFENNRDNPVVKSELKEKAGDFEGAAAEIDKALKKHPDDSFLASYRDDLVRRKLLFRGEGTTVPVVRDADCEHPNGVHIRKTDGVPA
jgi:hypothetical protein